MNLTCKQERVCAWLDPARGCTHHSERPRICREFFCDLARAAGRCLRCSACCRSLSFTIADGDDDLALFYRLHGLVVTPHE